MGETVNIVCTCDANYTAHLATMLWSLIVNNRRRKFRVFVLCDGDIPGKEKLAEFLPSDRVELSLIPLKSSALIGLPVGHCFPRVIYAQLFIDRLLPVELDRVLYLDCDLIVRGDIGELWATDLRGRTIGAAAEATAIFFREKLGLPLGAPYFNNGVLVIDLTRWRERKVGERVLAIARESPERLTWFDQCAMNIALEGDWLPLDPIWNHQQSGDGVRYQGVMHFRKMTTEERRTIRIAHFTGTPKPWHFLNYHPLKKEYLEYRSHTPWPLAHFEDRYPYTIVWRFLHRYFPLMIPLYAKIAEK